MLWNVNGLENTAWLMDSMCRHPKHLLLLTETHTSTESPPPHIPGYQNIHAPERRAIKGKTHGGICIYIPDSISRHITHCIDRCTPDKLWIKISAQIGTPEDIYLGVC